MKNIFESSMLHFEWQTCWDNHVVCCAHLRMHIKAMMARVRWKNPQFWETYHAIRSCNRKF